MTKFLGPQFSIGIGKESTRGTPVAAAYYTPWVSLSVDDKIQAAIDTSQVGVIEQDVGQEITTFTSEATLEGNMDDLSFGLILMSLMGTDTVGAVETGVKDHKFTVLQTSQHPSLSLSVYGPNESTGLVYPLAMLESLELSFELDKYATFKAVYKANKNASQANTVSFVAANKFRPQDGAFGIAPTLAGVKGTQTATGTAASTIHVTAVSINPQTLLQVGMTVTGTNIPVGATIATIVSATAYDLSVATTGAIGTQTFGPAPLGIKKLTLLFKKNTEDDKVLGNTSPIDRLNKSFSCDGSFELYYTDRTMIDTYMLGDLYKAIQIVMTNSGILIGATSHPTFTFNAAKVKLTEVARKLSEKNITMQTVKFKTFYSLSDSEMIDIILRNTVTTGY